jgi:two-component system response regulator PhoP
MLHIGEVVSKTTLTEHIYDQDFDLDSNVIEVFIRRLRKKLDPKSKHNFIETKRGQGYRLINFSI